LLPLPETTATLLATFNDLAAAGAAVAAIIAEGLQPSGLEMMDNPAIRAAEAFVNAGYPLDAAAIILCEFDGLPEQVAHDVSRAEAVLLAEGATRVQQAYVESERKKLWAGRKAAFPAVGRITPDYYCMDGTIPRRQLARVLSGIADLAAEFGLRVANVFHAGDGNLHPLIMFDANDAESFRRAEAFGADILKLCVEVGGCLTGEHGVGVEKRDLMTVQFLPHELTQQRAIKSAFDPAWLLNPAKVFPLQGALAPAIAAE
jgi:glycolate oxidase